MTFDLSFSFLGCNVAIVKKISYGMTTTQAIMKYNSVMKFKIKLKFNDLIKKFKFKHSIKT